MARNLDYKIKLLSNEFLPLASYVVLGNFGISVSCVLSVSQDGGE